MWICHNRLLCILKCGDIHTVGDCLHTSVATFLNYLEDCPTNLGEALEETKYTFKSLKTRIGDEKQENTTS